MNRLTKAVETFTDKRLNKVYILRMCSGLLIIYLISLSILFSTQRNGRTVFGPFLGADFASFYIAGEIYNTVGHDEIYDPTLQSDYYMRMTAGQAPNEELPFANAPFFILPFVLSSKLPYIWAYIIWMILSALLYIGAILSLLKRLPHIQQGHYSLIAIVCITFMPFLLEDLSGGQVAAFGFFWLSFAIILDLRDQPFLSGLALSMCLYKPTLLLLILPMLVITGRFRALAGLFCGSAILGLLSIATVGMKGISDYVNSLMFFANQSYSSASGLRTWKYVDANSFFRLLLEGAPYVRWLAFSIYAIFFGYKLLYFWRNVDRADPRFKPLVWAGTIAFTVVLNVYVGLYDSILVPLSVVLCANFLFGGSEPLNKELPGQFRHIVLALYITPWVTELFAVLLHVQLLTVIITLYGIYLLRLGREARPVLNAPAINVQ